MILPGGHRKCEIRAATLRSTDTIDSPVADLGASLVALVSQDSDRLFQLIHLSGFFRTMIAPWSIRLSSDYPGSPYPTIVSSGSISRAPHRLVPPASVIHIEKSRSIAAFEAAIASFTSTTPAEADLLRDREQVFNLTSSATPTRVACRSSLETYRAILLIRHAHRSGSRQLPVDQIKSVGRESRISQSPDVSSCAWQRVKIWGSVAILLPSTHINVKNMSTSIYLNHLVFFGQSRARLTEVREDARAPRQTKSSRYRRLQARSLWTRGAGFTVRTL